jgi:hypothetical protein
VSKLQLFCDIRVTPNRYILLDIVLAMFLQFNIGTLWSSVPSDVCLDGSHGGE